MERVLFSIYKLFCFSTFGRIIISKTEYEVGRYLPFDNYGMGVTTARVFLSNLFKAFFIAGLAFSIAFFDIKYLPIAIMLGGAAYKDSFVKWKRKQEKTILRQLSSYLNELRREYYRFNDVEEAFLAAFSAAGEELKLHLGLIEEAMDGDGVPERYRDASPNRFLFIFIAICQCAIKYGDNDNTFVSNIDELQKNIDSDLLKWEREDFIFSAVFFAICFAIISLPIMERWAISQVEGLTEFYDGFKGSVTRAACLVITLLFVIFFEKMQEIRCDGITPLLSGIMEIGLVNKGFKWLFDNTHTGKSSIADIFDKNFPEKSYQHFILSRIFWFIGSFVIGLLWIIYWQLSLVLMIPAILIAFCMSFIPHLSLVIDGMFYEAMLEEEIGQVRLMTISLAGVIGMTVEEILLWIENFTSFLRDSVSTCIDELDVDENDALDLLRDRWKTTSFINVIDDLIASDKIGINEAFKDLLSRRDYYSAKRRQEQELIVRKKEAIISTFLYLPFMLSVGAYMIAPFLVISVRNLLDITVKLS